MANIAEINEFTEGVYQLATTDPVEGGPLGISNAQAQALANRTLWLKNQIQYTWVAGDIKEVDCTNAYITAHFDVTGMGIEGTEREGWAICNGQNGTRDRSERTGIGFGGSFGTMGATGGSKNAVVVSHSHTINSDIMVRQTVSGGEVADYGNDIPLRPASSAGATNTSSTGESGTGKNMQPYIVTLFIQKL